MEQYKINQLNTNVYNEINNNEKIFRYDSHFVNAVQAIAKRRRRSTLNYLTKNQLRCWFTYRRELHLYISYLRYPKLRDFNIFLLNKLDLLKNFNFFNKLNFKIRYLKKVKFFNVSKKLNKLQKLKKHFYTFKKMLIIKKGIVNKQDKINKKMLLTNMFIKQLKEDFNSKFQKNNQNNNIENKKKQFIRSKIYLKKKNLIFKNPIKKFKVLFKSIFLFDIYNMFFRNLLVKLVKKYDLIKKILKDRFLIYKWRKKLKRLNRVIGKYKIFESHKKFIKKLKRKRFKKRKFKYRFLKANKIMKHYFFFKKLKKLFFFKLYRYKNELIKIKNLYKKVNIETNLIKKKN